MDHLARSPRLRTDGDWWVLLVTDGLTVEFPPELYRDHHDAEREAERWARLLSERSRANVERPFPDRWEVGDEWVRLVSSFLQEQGTEIWVGTYWTRDGSPEPEAELFADGPDALAWVREPSAGAVLAESHDSQWSAWARYRVRGGEEDAEVHRAKLVSSVGDPMVAEGATWIVYGFEVSEGLIPQGPSLFASEAGRDQALRELLEGALSQRDWTSFVTATAASNYVESNLSAQWINVWSPAVAIDWLLGFDFISDGEDLEIRSFEAGVM